MVGCTRHLCIPGVEISQQYTVCVHVLEATWTRFYPFYPKQKSSTLFYSKAVLTFELEMGKSCNWTKDVNYKWTNSSSQLRNRERRWVTHVLPPTEGTSWDKSFKGSLYQKKKNRRLSLLPPENASCLAVPGFIIVCYCRSLCLRHCTTSSRQNNVGAGGCIIAHVPDVRSCAMMAGTREDDPRLHTPHQKTTNPPQHKRHSRRRMLTDVGWGHGLPL